MALAEVKREHEKVPVASKTKPASKSNEALQRLFAASIIAPALGWLAYVYERMTGLTMTLSRHPALGNNSSAAHLASTLRNAIIISVLFIPLAFVLRSMVRTK